MKFGSLLALFGFFMIVAAAPSPALHPEDFKGTCDKGFLKGILEYKWGACVVKIVHEKEPQHFNCPSSSACASDGAPCTLHCVPSPYGGGECGAYCAPDDPKNTKGYKGDSE